MSLLWPTLNLDKVRDITADHFKLLGVRNILLDVDNTLAIHGSQEPFDGVIEWTQKMRELGMRIVIVSNNFKKRVAPFAQKFDLPFEYLSLKPLPVGFIRARRHLRAKRKETVVIGDQIFTDILGANLAGMKSILLRPTGKEESLTFHIRRSLEEPIRRRIEQSEAQS